MDENMDENLLPLPPDTFPTLSTSLHPHSHNLPSQPSLDSLRLVGVRPSGCPQEEDFAQQEAVALHGGQGIAGRDGPEQVLGMRDGEEGASAVPVLCEWYVPLSTLVPAGMGD